MAAVAVLEPEKSPVRPTHGAQATEGRKLSDTSAARAYGERAAWLSGFAERVWEDVAPLLRSGSECRDAEVCPMAARHDFRLSWPAVKDGWIGAGGRTLANGRTGQEAR